MGTCSLYTNFIEPDMIKKNDTLTLTLSTKSTVSSIKSTEPITIPITVSTTTDPGTSTSTSEENPDSWQLGLEWLTRSWTPMDNYADNKNYPESKIIPFFGNEFTSKKAKAYLISHNKCNTNTSIYGIYWTNTWGYIVIDSDNNPIIYSLGINLSQITDKKNPKIKIGETCGNLVIGDFSRGSQNISLFLGKDIKQTTNSGNTFLRSVGKKECFGPNTIGFNLHQYKQFRDQPQSKNLNQFMDFYCLQKQKPFTNPFLTNFSTKDETKNYGLCDITNVSCVCIVQKVDHWEMLCGHFSGHCSLWRMDRGNLVFPISHFAEYVETVSTMVDI